MQNDGPNSSIPAEIRREVRDICRGRGQDWMGLQAEMLRLINQNPDWRSEIASAVEELVGDRAYDWEYAIDCLREAGIPVSSRPPTSG